MSHTQRQSSPVCTVPALVRATILMVLATSAHAQTPPPSSTRVAPGGTTRVYVMAAFGADCQATAAPTIDVVKPPTNGTVSLRPGQSTTVASSLSGQCIGAKVQGTGIYYSANATTQGHDSFSVRAKLATGETIERTFHLRIED
jgi:hypothetical protein